MQTSDPAISIGTFDRGPAAQSVEDAANKAKDVVDRAAEATASAVRRAGLKGVELRDQLKTKKEEWAGSTRESVQAHPLTSMAIAVGVGVLLDRLTLR